MIEPSGAELQILPLGGCGEIGLNATLFIAGQDCLLVDCGALLGVEGPGVEKAVPGFEPLFAQDRRLLGVVLTHGHEDHIGALPALLAERDVPVFGTPLTLAMARSRLERTAQVAVEARRQAQRLTEVPLGSHVRAGPFEVELIRVTHSIPDAAALMITTRAGRVLHSGDFKLDPSPLDGLTTNHSRLMALGEQGVDLLLSDSTNAERPGQGASECVVAEALDTMIASCRGRVVATLVASHFHRLRCLVEAARRHGRKVALVGRALEENWRIGVIQGLLPGDASDLVAHENVGALPRDRLLIIATGAQGELQGGLTRIASGKESSLRCLAGDRVILSARVIPGNERTVRKLVNQLVTQGVDVVQDRMAPVHCSGHAHAGEQAELIRWTRPKNFVPVHGDRVMLEAHARTALSAGVPAADIQVIEDGQSIILSNGQIARGPDEVISRRPLDASGRVLDWGDVRERTKIGRAGLLVCSLALDIHNQLVGAPVVTFRGLSVPNVLKSALEQKVAAAVIPQSDPEFIVRTLLRQEMKHYGLPPEVAVHILRLRS